MDSPHQPLDPEAVGVLAGARLLALDVDGTLTDGGVVYATYPGAGDCSELQAFHVHDGQGLAWLKRADVAVAWITGRGCAATRRRAKELGVARLVERAGPKDEALAEVQKQLGIPPEQTLAMGDDLPDLLLGRRAAFFAAPADARAEVRAAADLVTGARGGRGAVRELVEAILAAKGLWPSIAAPESESAG